MGELWCRGVKVWGSCGVGEVRCGGVKVWGSCSAVWGSCGVGELWWVVLRVEGIAVCGGYGGYQTLVYSFLGIFQDLKRFPP